MQMTWKELPLKVKIYIVLLSCLATPIALWALWQVFTVEYDNGWFVLFALTLITIPFVRYGLFYRSVNTITSIGDSFVLAIAMIFGAAPCLATTFANTLLISIIAPRPKVYPYRVVFNTASSILVAWIYSSVFHLVNRVVQFPVSCFLILVTSLVENGIELVEDLFLFLTF